mgnify:CR=1 FL=1
MTNEEIRKIYELKNQGYGYKKIANCKCQENVGVNVAKQLENVAHNVIILI